MRVVEVATVMAENGEEPPVVDRQGAMWAGVAQAATMGRVTTAAVALGLEREAVVQETV